MMVPSRITAGGHNDDGQGAIATHDPVPLAAGRRGPGRGDVRPCGWAGPVSVDVGMAVARPAAVAIVAGQTWHVALCGGLLIFASVLRRRERRTAADDAGT